MMDAVVIAVAVAALLFLVRYVLLPLMQLQRRRQQSREHHPQPQEIWVQGEGILYIDDVSDAGVDLLAFNPESKTLYRWRDSWDEWRQRLRVNVCYFSGQRRVLERG